MKIRFASICLVASTLSGVSPAAVGSWTNTGPEGGVITSMVTTELDPQLIYASTLGGGIFRSTSGGEVWSAVNQGIEDYLITALVHRDPSTLYAASKTGRIFTSVDGGDQWTERTSPTGDAIIALTISPTALYAMTSQEAFVSDDDGNSWRSSAKAEPAQEFFFLLSSPDGRLYLGGSVGLLVSADGGSTWAPSSAPQRLEYTAMVAAGTRIFAAASGRVYASYDSGKQWKILPPTPVVRPIFRSLVSSSQNTLYAVTSDGIFVYNIARRRWKSVGEIPAEPVVLARTSSFPPRLYAGTAGAGVFATSESFFTWLPVNGIRGRSRARHRL